MATYSTLQAYLAAVDVSVFENTQGLVTASVVNDLLKAAGNRTWDIAMRGYDLPVVTTTTTITFVSGTFADTSYLILTRGYNAQGDPVDLKITNKTTSGFDVTPAVDGFIDYLAEK